MAHNEGPFHRQPFDHRQHVKFAWTVLEELPLPEATEVVSSEIREFAALHAPGKYHETLTQFWVRLVAHTREHRGVNAQFDEHLARFPILMDSGAQTSHYSSTVLWSPLARSEFVEPDLLPLP
jgi:hypothetical protein